MKLSTRILSLFLAVLLCLSGCNQSPAPTTQPTLSGDATTIYNNAAQRIVDAQNLHIVTTTTQQITTAGQSFTATTNEQLTYLGLHADNFAAAAEKTINYGDYETALTECYTGGTVYTTILESNFRAAMPADVYMKRYTPAVIITPENYGQISVADNTVTFTDALQPESWLSSEEITLESATASATIDSAGNLKEARYTVTYTYGGAQITKAIVQTVTVPESSVTIAAPADPAQYTEVASIDALLMLEQAYGYVHQSTQLQASLSESTFSQAAGYATGNQSTIHTYATDSAPMIQVEQTSNSINYTTGETSSHALSECYRDGKYTISENGALPTADASVTADGMREYYMSMILELILELDYINGGTCTDLGNVYLAEYTCADILAQDYCSDISRRLFNDENLLTNMASAYRTTQLEYYVAMDKYTGLPTALGISFSGVHTISGVEYLLSEQAYCSLDLASTASYTAITNEIAPDTEPEVKATPLLYQVTGTNGQKMWLFGTIHIGDDRTGYLPQQFYDVLNESDALAIECDTEAFEQQVKTDPALQAAVSGAYYYADAKTASRMNDQQLHADTMRLLKAIGAYNANIDSMKMSIWEQSISNFYLRQGGKLSSNKGMESRLTRLAKAQSIPIWEVESTLAQMQMLTGFSESLQEMMLAATIKTGAKTSWESAHQLYELWCSGDEAAIRAYLGNETAGMSEAELAVYGEYQKAMYTDRNAYMLQVAQQYLESGNTVFYAVGLAHLLADDGLVNTLRAAGYTVEPVSYS